MSSEKMENRICQNCKKDFVIEQEDFNFYEKIKVPPPTWCPYCRFIRKLTFINERYLYKRPCDSCKEVVISMYRPEEPITAWCADCYLNKPRDGFDYGMNYDFSRTFFEQFKKLRNSVPHRTLDQNTRSKIRCEYSNYCFDSKNVYLSFNILGGENIKYSKHLFKDCKDCVDCLIIKKNDHCYEAVQSSYSYDSSFLIESEQCISSSFLYDCINCINCCLSSNLRNKSCVFKNEQLSKEDYQKALLDLKLDTYSGQTKTKQLFKNITEKAIHRYAHIKNCVNSSGDFIENTKNCFRCYGLVGAENVKDSFLSMSLAKDSQGLIYTGRAEECYEIVHGGKGISKSAFCFRCGNSSIDLFYCENCKNCSNCFGCVGLEKNKYCIFNKQYTKEEYEVLICKIKKHMHEMPYIDQIGRFYAFGEYFPSEISPFMFNETTAFEENPLSEKEILAQGYRWMDKEKKLYETTFNFNQIPDSISEVEDNICEEIISCPNKGKVETQCTYGYKILPDELSFYRQMHLPIPRFCPNCRYYYRLKWKNHFIFYKRQCMCSIPIHEHNGKCEVEFETTYSPDNPNVIYCKKCYQQEVY